MTGIKSGRSQPTKTPKDRSGKKYFPSESKAKKSRVVKQDEKFK